MSLCICPRVGLDGMYDAKQRQFVADFLKGLSESGAYAEAEWNMLNIQDFYHRVGSLKAVEDVIPFRGGGCSRTRRCCGECTRVCKTRCVQDCLHRIYTWRQQVKYTPTTELLRIPLSIRLIINQTFESHEQMALCVGDILSQYRNTQLSEDMEKQGLTDYNHPYHNDYSPSVVIDSATGKRRVNPDTGEIVYRNWPETGLCPYCLPDVMIDGSRLRRRKS